MIDSELDSQVRLRAFRFLRSQSQYYGEILPRSVLQDGFEFEGTRVPLIAPQGIFKPAILEIPLTITTVPAVEGKERPYADALTPDGLLRYCYRGTDPNHRDNAGLRLAMIKRLPLAYFHGIVPGEYFARWPVYIVGDVPSDLHFKVVVDAVDALDTEPQADTVVEARRLYVTRETEQRLHQQKFRAQVLRAYRERCAVCRLKHKELLDAAHILPDRHPSGEPVVPNGLALCKLHHAAFDRHFLGISPDLRIHLRGDILEEPDGPMLRHGLQGFEGLLIHVPRAPTLQPNRSYLEERFSLFRRAS